MGNLAWTGIERSIATPLGLWVFVPKILGFSLGILTSLKESKGS